MNKKLSEGIEKLSEGFNLFLEGIVEEVTKLSDEVNTSTEVKEVTEKPSTKKSAKKPVEVSPEEDNSEYSEEELNSMSYNDLKKLAKDKGISATGNRKELVKKLLSGETESDESEESAEDEVEETPKKTPAKKGRKTKTPEPVEDEEDEDEEEPEDDEDESDEDDSIESQVNELTADMSVEELRELLESVDISSKGKRQALISKIVTAVSEGIISLEDEDEDDTDSESEDEDAEESGDITENMTKKRKKAYKELCDETNEQFENEEITREDLIEFINEYNGTNDKMKKVSDEELIAQYLEISAMLIDDEGEIVEEGAYYINDEPYCCGHPLTYDKKKKQYVCEHCGAEYDED